MKKLIALLTFLFLVSTGFSQDHDNRLLEKYSAEQLDHMKENEPARYQFLNIALEKAIFIGPIPTQKGKDVEFNGELDVDPTADHNFISLGIELKENEYQYFKIKGTDQMIGVLPKSLIK